MKSKLSQPTLAKINTFRRGKQMKQRKRFLFSTVLLTVAAMASKSIKMRPEFQNFGPPLVGERFFGCWGRGFYCTQWNRIFSLLIYPKTVMKSFMDRIPVETVRKNNEILPGVTLGHRTTCG